MHSSKHRDPLISRAEPVTIITPVVDETLRMAGVPSVREQIIDRFMNGQDLLRVMIVVAGAGPHASGMPELQVASNASSHPLASISVLVTDGRVSYQNEGISIAHVVPEALDGGGLAPIRTGDWIYLDLAQGEFQVVTRSNLGYKVLAPERSCESQQSKEACR